MHTGQSHILSLHHLTRPEQVLVPWASGLIGILYYWTIFFCLLHHIFTVALLCLDVVRRTNAIVSPSPVVFSSHTFCRFIPWGTRLYDISEILVFVKSSWFEGVIFPSWDPDSCSSVVTWLGGFIEEVTLRSSKMLSRISLCFFTLWR